MAGSPETPIPRHGVPHPACEEEPTGLPTSDRHHSETAPADTGGSAKTPKHDHNPGHNPGHSPGYNPSHKP